MPRGGATDPVLAERDNARRTLQEQIDTKLKLEAKLKLKNEQMADMMEKLRLHMGDPPAFHQLRVDHQKLQDDIDLLTHMLQRTTDFIAELERVANPPAIGRPPWETGAGRKKKTRKNVIGPLKKGELTSLGYSASKKAKTRRQALEKAVDRYGPLSTLRKVNAIRVLTKRRAPKVSKTLKADVKYLQKHYF